MTSAAVPPSPTRLWMAAALAVTAWASAFVIIRDVGQVYSPVGMALLRLLVAWLVLTPVVLRTGLRRPPRAHWPWLVACGAGWLGLYNVALNAGETMVDAGTAAMLVNVAPLLVVVFGGVFLREGFPAGVVWGAVVAFVGVGLIAASSAGGRIDALGVLLCLVAAGLYAAGALVQKRLLRHLDALSCTWWFTVFGTAVLLPWFPQLVTDVRTAPPAATLWVVYLGVVPTALGFLAWAYVLTHTTAGRASVTTYIVPALAVLMAWAFLAETPPLLAVLGGVCSLVGVFLSRIRTGPWRRHG